MDNANERCGRSISIDTYWGFRHVRRVSGVGGRRWIEGWERCRLDGGGERLEGCSGGLPRLSEQQAVAITAPRRICIYCGKTLHKVPALLRRLETNN